MDNDFTLSIDYKGEQKDYEARLLQFGYSYRIVVAVKNIEVYFEPDEERNFRVVAMPGQDEKSLSRIDKNLLAIIKDKIEEIIN
jgi:hypothetical protein